MDEENSSRHNNKPPVLGGRINLAALSNHQAFLSVEQTITALEATNDKDVTVLFRDYESTPENHRRVIEPLCRCLANLRRHNPKHSLRALIFEWTKKADVDAVDQFLVAAKQYGIHDLSAISSRIPIQSLVEFCRDNTRLQLLYLSYMTLSDDPSTMARSPPWMPEALSSLTTRLDKLTVWEVTLENVSVAHQCSNWMATVLTYPALDFGGVDVGYKEDDDDDAYARCRRKKKYGTEDEHAEKEEKEEDHDTKEKRIARTRVVSALIQPPSVQELRLYSGCRIEDLAILEASATVTDIEVGEKNTPHDFRPYAVRKKVQAIASRNRMLARFVANPNQYRDNEFLLDLLQEFDHCPTGRIMLARAFPEMPSFIKTDESEKPNKK